MVGGGSFEDRRVDQGAPAEPTFAAYERRQAVLLRVLHRRQGAGVSFAELHDIGVELPATVVSELELVGVPIERCVVDAGGARTVGVRLDPAWPGAPAPQQARLLHRRTVDERRTSHDRFANTVARYRRIERLGAQSVVALARALTGAAVNLHDRMRDLRIRDRVRAIYLRDHLRDLRIPDRLHELDLRDRLRDLGIPDRLRVLHLRDRVHDLHLPDRLRDVRASITSRDWMPSNPRDMRLLAPAGLLVVLAVIVALVVGQIDSRARGTTSAEAHPRAHIYTPGSANARKTRHTPRSVHVPVSPALAAELELRGHELLGAGQYAQAARLLNKALAASGENLQRCLQPVSELCLTYAYALYDLGRALMLSGSPAAAVPVLERRLQIENQRPIVAVTLEQARARVG